MGLHLGDFVAFLRYSEGKRHVRGDTWSSGVCTVYPVTDDDG